MLMTPLLLKAVKSHSIQTNMDITKIRRKEAPLDLSNG